MNKMMEIAAALLLVVGLVSVSADVEVRASDLVVSEDFAASFEVTPSADVLEFLDSFGIDPNGDRYEVTRQIDKLRDSDSSNDDVWATAKDELNYHVNQVLFSTISNGYEPVYMTIGNTRWTMAPYVDDE